MKKVRDERVDHKEEPSGIRIITEEKQQKTRGSVETLEPPGKVEDHIASTSPDHRFTLSPSKALIAMVMLVGMAIAVFSYLISRKPKEAAASPSVRSIAVLPFKGLENDGSDEYLGLGIADTLITKLSNVRQIVVRPTSAVRKYNTDEQDPVAIGREQGVDAVLQGSIRRADEQIRVTVQLVRVSDGRPLWAGKFDEKFTEIFTVEDLISERVAEALALNLTGAEKKQLAKRYTENTEAYQLYLKGSYFRRKYTKEGFEKSIQYFEQALNKDPAYAPAYAGLAQTYNRLGVTGLWPANEACQKQEWAALKALEIDDTLAEAHVTLGGAKLSNWDWSAAEREFRRGIELDPNSVDAHHDYSYFLSAMERHDEALREVKRAQELEPNSAQKLGSVAKILLSARQYDQAIEQYLKAIEMDSNFAPFHANLGVAYLAKGMSKEALAELQKARALEDAPERRGRFALLAYAYAITGKKAEAVKMLNELKELSKERYISPYNFAIIYVGLGEKDRALDWLEKAYQEKSEALVYLKVSETFDSLRSDSRFRDLLRRMNLAP
ncbi:MAG: tetratricopeptide repeat protein [Pyrinomonadaceae bacterium]